MCSKVSNVSGDGGRSSLLAMSGRYGEQEAWQVEHPVRPPKAELLDLAINVAKEGVTGPMSVQST
jgi:hypothetical protein